VPGHVVEQARHVLLQTHRQLRQLRRCPAHLPGHGLPDPGAAYTARDRRGLQHGLRRDHRRLCKLPVLLGQDVLHRRLGPIGSGQRNANQLIHRLEMVRPVDRQYAPDIDLLEH
jgi:hypothetical protein